MKIPRVAALACWIPIAAMPAIALDWNDGDPAAQLSSMMAPRGHGERFAATPPSASGAPVGQFDSYIFALEWEPAFCEGKTAPECGAHRGGRFDSTNLSLHGLWPDRNGDAQHSYGFCGDAAKEQPLDNAATWCKMPALNLSADTLAELKTVMPGVSSCLQNHEWYKHGSCSGLTPDQFFSAAAALIRQVAQTSLGQFLSRNVGQSVSSDQLLAAFESDFGPGSRRFVSLTCTNVGGRDLLLDVRLKLANPLRPAAELAQMMLPNGGGNCPATFAIDAAPALAFR